MNTASHRRSPVRARLLAASLLLAVIGAVTAAPAASAVPLSHASLVSATQQGQPASGRPTPGVVSWSVAPASATGVDSRTRFLYPNIKPGTFIFDHVAVFNRSSQAAAFTIYATDATGTATDGALTLLPAGVRPRGIGAWTTFSGHRSLLSVIIPGGKGVIEPFTIRVPFRATPGDHIGGMIAAVGVPRRTASGTLVTLYERIAVPMELRVTGRLVAGLSITSVSVGLGNPFNPFGGGGAHVTYSVVNTGNVILGGTQTVTVTGPFGVNTIHAPKLPSVLPGDSITYTLPAGSMFPAGSVTAHVTVTPAWPADATPLAVALASASASASLFALPWALLVLIVVLAAGGYAWWRRMKARRRTHEAEIADAADRARRETERRLLGGANGKSSARPGTAGKSAARPGTAGTSPTGPGPAGKSSASPGAAGKIPARPGPTGKPSATRDANGRSSTKPAPNSAAQTVTRAAASAAPAPATNPAAEAAATPAVEPTPEAAATPAAETAAEAAAAPAVEAAATAPIGLPGGPGQPE